MDDVCACGNTIVQPHTGRRRRWCTQCSPQNNRAQQARAQLLQLPVREIDPNEGLVGATRRKLEEWSMAHTWQGCAAIKLAELVDQGRHGASGPAGVIKAHRESMAFCQEQAPTEEADIIFQIFAAED
jgi:hypothetical protein